MTKRLMFANEFLDEISKAPEGEEREAKLRQYGALSPLNFLLSMNFDTTIKFQLPDGMPPYKRDEAVHQDLNAPLSTCIKRILNCLVSTPRLTKTRKEFMFIQILEGIGHQEADILVACKDRALEELYPLITKELVQKVFPAYVK